MASGILYRNVRARDQLELFLLSAASSLLLLRFYLHLTGYPQVGSGSLHIAHMLWGGLLMVAAIAMLLSFVGARAQRLAAGIGGAGFGIFIDEIGKFITRDNNYFYQPAVGIIYVIFILLYLGFNFLSRRRPLTSREYQLNALAQLEEAVLKDMDPIEKRRVQELISRANQDDPLTRQLQRFLNAVQTTPPGRPAWPARMVGLAGGLYRHFWVRKDSIRWVRVFFFAEVIVLFVGIALGGNSYSNIHSILTMPHGIFSYDTQLLIGQLAASVIAAGFTVWGIVLLRTSRLRAYEQFRRAALINIFLTQIFTFSRIEFRALPGFFFNLLLLAVIGYATREEQRAVR